jgi:hypothetical protein
MIIIIVDIQVKRVGGERDIKIECACEKHICFENVNNNLNKK